MGKDVRSLEHIIVSPQKAKQISYPLRVEKFNQLIEFIKTYRTGDAIKTEYAKWITKNIVNNPRAFSAATKEASELLRILCDEGYISKQEIVGGGMSIHTITSYALLPDKVPELKAYLSRLRKNN